MSIQTFLTNIISFLNNTIIPLIIAIAFLFFIWNMARYFIIGGASEDNREKAKRNAFYGILAFVIIVSIWGIVNLLVVGLGFDRETPLLPDYMKENWDPWKGLR